MFGVERGHGRQVEGVPKPGIASFAHVSLASDARSGLHDARTDSDIGGQLACALKAAQIADFCQDGHGGDESDAIDRYK